MRCSVVALSCAAGAAVSLFAAPAGAGVPVAEWIGATSGTFGDMTRWSTGEVPDGTVDTMFLAGGAYTVGFGEMRTSRQVRVTNGDVTFDGGGFGHGSSLTIQEFPATALQIGGASNTTTSATYLNGTFDYSSVRIGTDAANFSPPLPGVDATLTFGAGSILNAEFIFMNSDTNAMLVFEGGAQATLTGSGIIAPEQPGLSQTVYVRGGGTAVDYGNFLDLGEGGTGTLEVTDGAELTGGNLKAGNISGSSASILVDNATMNINEISTTIQSTSDASATMDIVNGGYVRTQSGFTNWGNRGTGLALATISGGGSHWLMNAGSVGWDAHGRVEVSDGGRFTASVSHKGLGGLAGGVGEVDVSGAGSVMFIARGQFTDFDIGQLGFGSITVSGEATLEHSGNIDLGEQATGRGEVTVSGAGTSAVALFDNEGGWTIGKEGEGDVQVEDSASMSVNTLIFGEMAGAYGELRAVGGSSLTVGSGLSDEHGLMRIGVGGQGLYELSGGSTGVSNEITLGEEQDSRGDMLLTGDGTEHTVRTGDVRVGQMGEATLTVADGARLRILDGALFVGRMGEILGDGTIESGVVIDGSISPNAGGGEPMRIGGDYGQTSDGRLEIEILGDPMSGLFGALDVMGEAMLAGTLVVQLDSAFTPSPGQSYEIISAASIVGEFEDVLLEVPADASRGDTPGDLRVSVTYGDGSVSIAVIPAPATGLAAALGLCLAGGRRRA